MSLSLVEELKESRNNQILSKEKIPEEFSSLQKGQNVKRTSHIYKLNPVLEEGVLRVGRLIRAAMPLESKHPDILDKDLHISPTSS